MKKKKQYNLIEDLLNTVKKNNRDNEIFAHGHRLCYTKVFKNKKKYSRKKLKKILIDD